MTREIRFCDAGQKKRFMGLVFAFVRLYKPRFAERSGQLGLPSLLNRFNVILEEARNAQIKD